MTGGAIDWDAVLRDRVLFHLGVAGGGLAAPVWTFVCGQPGSGKSTRMASLASQLGPDRTQVISADAIHDLVAGLFADLDDPAVQAAKQQYDSTIEEQFITQLVDRAARQGAHILWEAHLPGDLVALCGLGQALGYRIELEVLAEPLDPTWLATLERDSARSTGPRPVGVSWNRQLASYHSWPPFLAAVEDAVSVDALRILDRGGAVLFANTVQATGAPRRWTDPPLAMESLLVERLRPQDPAALTDLLARWQALRHHPGIAFRNLPIWPHADVMALGDRLRAARADPAARFDLAAPSAVPEGARGWQARLQASIADAAASPEGQRNPGFAPRADRLLALVGTILAPALSPDGSSGFPG